MATETTIENAMLALPFLVKCARLREVITYKELADKIDRHHRTLNHALGYIRDEICIPADMPMLNCIVVNSSTRLPGESFLPEGTAHLSSEEYQQKYVIIRDEVFSCLEWEDILRKHGLDSVEKSMEDLDKEGTIYNQILERRGPGSGEAPAHAKLKAYIASHPAAIGLVPEEEGEQEHEFISGDRCDVIFDIGMLGMAVVEIKNGERGELIKGIYQAIKYRALMEAEKGHGVPSNVQAYLVAYQIPKDIQEFASKFGIRCYTIPRSVVMS